jgi:ABC-type glycerol-3-phosphate transport system substrate-binding protein
MLLILTALLLFGFTACDSKDNKKAGTDVNKKENNLKIYYMNYDTTIQNALITFREKYKDVNVEDSVFNNDDEYKNKVTMDILSGEGPDVILIRPHWFQSANKFLLSGALSDINELIKNDKDFNMSDFNENVLNSFEKDGKRLTIPLQYGVNILITSKEALQRNNIKIDPSNWDYNALLQVIKKFQEENKGGNKYFFSSDFSISSLINGSGISFVDFKSKKSFFESKDFIKILETYRSIYPSICTDEAVKGISLDERLKNNIYIMTKDSKTSLNNIYINYSLFKSIGEEMEVLPFPALKGGNSSSVSYSDYSVGISTQSKNKEAAYNFIKILMSKDFQKTSSTENIIFGTPINKSAYEEDSEYVMSNKAEGIEFRMHDMDTPSYNYLSVSLSKNIKTQMDNIISKVDRCEIIDVEIMNIVKEALPNFLNGKNTAARTAKEINDKVNLYLNE